MLQRYAIALAGACVVTVILLYTMSAIAEYFNRPDSQVYLRVMDVIPGSGARRLPERRMPAAQPERARVEQLVESVETTESDIAFEEIPQPIDVSVDLEQP
jgi:hypothetical protein